MDPERAKRFTDGYFIVTDPSGRILGRTDGKPLTDDGLDFIKNGPPSAEELVRRWRERKNKSTPPAPGNMTNGL